MPAGIDQLRRAVADLNQTPDRTREFTGITVANGGRCGQGAAEGGTRVDRALDEQVQPTAQFLEPAQGQFLFIAIGLVGEQAEADHGRQPDAKDKQQKTTADAHVDARIALRNFREGPQGYQRAPPGDRGRVTNTRALQRT